MTIPILPGISIRLIQQLVARRCGVPESWMTSPDHHRDAAWPRQLAMALACEFTRHSKVSVGRRFGGRDHSTVWHACQAVPIRAEWHRPTSEHLAFMRAMLDQLRPKPPEEIMDNLCDELGMPRAASREEIKAALNAHPAIDLTTGAKP